MLLAVAIVHLRKLITFNDKKQRYGGIFATDMK